MSMEAIASLAYGVRVDPNFDEDLVKQAGFKVVYAGNAYADHTETVIAIDVVAGPEGAKDLGATLSPPSDEKIYELIRFCEDKLGMKEATHGWWLCVSLA